MFVSLFFFYLFLLFIICVYNFPFFLVIPKINTPQYIEKDDRLIPQWAIAVIVIGVGGLLFIIVFGVSVVSVARDLSEWSRVVKFFLREKQK